MKKELVAPEVAVKEFERFCDAWGVEVPEQPSKETPEALKKSQSEIYASFQILKLTMLGYISKGILVVSENGDSVTQYCQYNSMGESKEKFTLTYSIPSLGGMFELDKADGTIASKAANIAVLSRNSRSKIAMMDPRDLKYAEPVVQFFFSLLA